MKKFKRLFVIILFVLNVISPCFANPLSKAISWFKGDIIVNIFYEDHNSLIQGNKVYLAGDLDADKILIPVFDSSRYTKVRKPCQ